MASMAGSKGGISGSLKCKLIEIRKKRDPQPKSNASSEIKSVETKE
ncbi:MAG: hypothetical protein KKC76_04265 [Proteobacteria bacterium]|nr:hypothetical protein [Pseudomonadota bacterium]MBU4296768.1 hypothetical protein [Pseudomonadota bacterium]MCG2747185.1 hypothetical protein [Desulfobulbaceae bacterium]